LDKNEKAIAVLFEQDSNFHQVVYGALNKALEDGNGEATFSELLQIFQRNFEVIASEFIASELLDVDLADYYDVHNDLMLADDVQRMIDDSEDDELDLD